MRHCSHCGGPVELRVPPGDNRPRHVCPACDAVHYQNPRLVVGCIPQWEDRVLLCRRAIEPAYGLWTLPAGFLELGEGTAEGAAREAAEEACIDVDIGPLFSLMDVPHIGQVHMLYLAHLREPRWAAGDESLEVALFAEADIPWSDLSFRSVRETLKHYFEDRRHGRFGLHTAVLGPPPGA